MAAHPDAAHGQTAPDAGDGPEINAQNVASVQPAARLDPSGRGQTTVIWFMSWKALRSAFDQASERAR